MERGPPFSVFVLRPLKPARERSKVPGVQSLPGICVSFLPNLCPMCAWVCVCTPGRGTKREASETPGCGCSAAALESASEGHTEVSAAPVPAPHCLCGPVLWNCTLWLLKWFCSQGAREKCLDVQLSYSSLRASCQELADAHLLLGETYCLPGV